ncbi:MAG: fumarate hydratase [Firmicutes bacterium]|nr:fumarate hydratase [Bacillota bacterium]
MRDVNVDEIRDAVAELCYETNVFLGADVTEAIHKAKKNETSPVGISILEQIEQNIEIAEDTGIPLCQDTGLTCVFLEIGQEVSLKGGFIGDAVNEGVRSAYVDRYLRKSVVEDPLRRINTNDNTPAHIVYDIVPGDRIKITVAPKGYGSENMSRIAMLTPADGEAGVRRFVLDAVKNAGGKPCPPIVVGVGIGGTFDQVAQLAKRALLKDLDEIHPDPYYAAMEQELLEEINEMDIGPQGMGGVTTALGVKILTAPTHIAGLPVAVNINCHVCRHKTVVI